LLHLEAIADEVAGGPRGALDIRQILQCLKLPICVDLRLLDHARRVLGHFLLGEQSRRRILVQSRFLEGGRARRELRVSYAGEPGRQIGCHLLGLFVERSRLDLAKQSDLVPRHGRQFYLISLRSVDVDGIDIRDFNPVQLLGIFATSRIEVGNRIRRGGIAESTVRQDSRIGRGVRRIRQAGQRKRQR